MVLIPLLPSRMISLAMIILRERSEALEKFKIFKAEVKNQHNAKIKVVHSDRGREYYGRHTPYGQIPGPFAKILEENDIVAQYL
jgi:hypothetical protein